MLTIVVAQTEDRRIVADVEVATALKNGSRPARGATW